MESVTILHYWCPDCVDTNDTDGCFEGEKIEEVFSTLEEAETRLKTVILNRKGAPLSHEYEIKNIDH